MDRKVIWSGTAVTDLDAAAEFISKDTPAYAATFVLRSLDAARSLSDLAERGRVVPEFKDASIREFLFTAIALSSGGETCICLSFDPWKTRFRLSMGRTRTITAARSIH